MFLDPFKTPLQKGLHIVYMRHFLNPQFSEPQQLNMMSMAFWAIFVVSLSFNHVSSKRHKRNSIEDSELTQMKNVITKLSDRLSHFEGRIGDVSMSLQIQNVDLQESIANLTTSIGDVSMSMQAQNANLQDSIANFTTKVSFLEEQFVHGYKKRKISLVCASRDIYQWRIPIIQ